MNMETVVEHYYSYYNTTDEYYEMGETDNVKKAVAAVEDYSKRFERKTSFEVVDLAMDLGATNHAQGFCYGFYSAVQLFAGCGVALKSEGAAV